jgi:predicted transcriptional regulator
MAKKRYTLYISRPLARKFDLVAQQRQGAKSALVEEALRASLEPQQHPGIEEGLARRLNELSKAVAAVGRDVTVATETLALFVRYFLTVTPPLPQSDQESARLIGKERFHVFLTEVGRRVAEHQRFASDVFQTITRAEPDLFAAAMGSTSVKDRQVASNDGPIPCSKSNGHATAPGEGDDG